MAELRTISSKIMAKLAVGDTYVKQPPETNPKPAMIAMGEALKRRVEN
jgi:hypothetical protein